MKKIETVAEMQRECAALRAAGRTIALVVTGGSIHEGHLALIRAAREKAEVVVVSLFPNPLQFGASEGFAHYPRTTEADVARCEEAGVDLVFLPAQEEMYPRTFSTFVVEETISKRLCGISRPTHFRGVTTVMVKLINIVRPDVLVMGQKDAQQVAVMRKIIADLNMSVEVVKVPIVRDADGLACHVRNATLTASGRKEAQAISLSLVRAQEMAASGVRSTDRIIAEVTHILGQQRRVRVIYVAIVDRTTMETVREVVPGEALLMIAAWLDEVRLTDNALL